MSAPRSFSFRLVGVTFATSYPLFVHELVDRAARGALPVTVSLERDADNAFDPNAVAVTSKIHGRIGDVPRHVAARIAPELDAGATYRARIVELIGHPDHPTNPGIQIHVERIDADIAAPI